LKTALCGYVPNGKTLVLTLGAPIKEPKKVLAALTEMLLTHLKNGVEGVERKKYTPWQSRTVSPGRRWAAAEFEINRLCFQRRPETRRPSECHAITAGRNRRAREETVARGIYGRSVACVSDRWIADAKTYRRMLSHLPTTGRFAKILIMLDGGRVENLAEEPRQGSGS
jgi:hypothetical protein